jgi:hypothetical protein
MALTLRKILNECVFPIFSLSVAACASVTPRSDADVEARLSRSGGLSGIRETIRLWSASGQPHGTLAASNETRARNVRLPSKTLDSSLVMLESLVGAVPPVPPDTGVLRRLCGDGIQTRIEVRRGNRIRSAQEECPHRTVASKIYWQRVDSLFRFLASAAQ